MSVLVSKRTPSKVQFITSAYELLVFTTKTIKKCPKTYTFYGLQKAYELAQDVLENLVRANQIFLTKENKESFLQRKDHFDKALSDLGYFSIHLNYLNELMFKIDKEDKIKPISSKRWVKWGTMINDLISLIKGIKKSDEERIK